MKILIGLSSCVTGIFFIIKFLIHLFIDDRMGYGIQFGFRGASRFYLPYDRSVEPDFLIWKKRCNLSLTISVVAFVMSLFFVLINSLLIN